MSEMTNTCGKLNVLIPFWQGGGRDLRTYRGAYNLKNNYANDVDMEIVDVSTADIAPTENDVLGYSDILNGLDDVNYVLREKSPENIFLIGGSCESGISCIAWLNKRYAGNMAIVYIDAHGDLNTPQASDSKLFYGMGLRALTGESDPEILDKLFSTVDPKQIIMCGNRNLDEEESRFKEEHNVSDFTAGELNSDPTVVAKEIIKKGMDNVFIHIDLDCLDPSEFSESQVPEPDGLTCEALISILEKIGETSNVVGLGILEYTGDENDKSNKLLKRLVQYGKEQV